jgi:hypothetical protein
MRAFERVEELVSKGVKLVEVELMLTVDELQAYAAYCKEHDVKFNDWIRELAANGLQKVQQPDSDKDDSQKGK